MVLSGLEPESIAKHLRNLVVFEVGLSKIWRRRDEIQNVSRREITDHRELSVVAGSGTRHDQVATKII